MVMLSEWFGGFQIENERQGIVNEAQPGLDICHVTKPFESLKNGQTFILDSPIIPTYRSVYSIFTNDMMEDQYNPYGYSDEAWEQNPYRAFYELCMYSGSERLIKGCGLVKQTLSTNEQKSAMKKYRVFVDNNGLDYNVQFFNNYHYTIFVPTNDAIANAIQKGLPTWEEIEEDYDAHRKPEMEEVYDPVTGEPVLDEEGNIKMQEVRDEDGEIQYSDELASGEDSLRIQTKITYLTNFIRNHFADNTIFADNSEIADNEMVTSSYDKELGLFCKIHVDRIKAGGETRLQTYEADKFILATGGFYSGGITMRDFGEGKEGVFGCDVVTDCEEATWANKQLFSDKKQGFALAGVKTYDDLRAIRAGGIIENLYVVGRNLTGYDFCFEHSGNGVALASAFKAAKA